MINNIVFNTMTHDGPIKKTGIVSSNLGCYKDGKSYNVILLNCGCAFPPFKKRKIALDFMIACEQRLHMSTVDFQNFDDCEHIYDDCEHIYKDIYQQEIQGG